MNEKAYGFIYNELGVRVKSDFFDNTVENVANYIMHNKSKATYIMGEEGDFIVSSTKGGFIDKACNDNYRKKLIDKILPLQMGDINAYNPSKQAVSHKPFDIPTLDGSLKISWLNGYITLHDVAIEFAKANWTPFINEEYALKKMLSTNIDKFINRIDYKNLAKTIDDYAFDSDFYEYKDTVDDRSEHIKEIQNKLNTGNVEEYIQYFTKEIKEDAYMLEDAQTILNKLKSIPQFKVNELDKNQSLKDRIANKSSLIEHFGSEEKMMKAYIDYVGNMLLKDGSFVADHKEYDVIAKQLLKNIKKKEEER